MDLKARKNAMKEGLKELPVWAYWESFETQMDTLELEIELNKSSIYETSDIADKLLKINTTGKLRIQPPKKNHDSDIVRLYRKNASGECVIFNPDDETTKIGNKKVSTNKIFLDSTINNSIKQLEERPKQGEEVYAMIEENKPWAKCEIKSVYHKPIPYSKERLTAFKLRIIEEKRYIEVSKFSVARIQNHGDKLRVPKRVIAGPTETNLRAGIIGQDPCDFNRYRYLVLMDDGSAHYFRPNQIYPIFFQSETPWQDCRQLGKRNLSYEAELAFFFRMYPKRRLLQIAVGEKFEIARNGLLVSAHLLSFDCDTMRIAYKDDTEESIYRGTARVVKRADLVRRLLSNHFSFDLLHPKLPGNMKRYHDAGLLALGESYLNFLENFDTKLTICGPNTARKSTASRSHSPPRFKVKLDSRIVEDDRNTKPFLQDIIERSKSHPRCGPECLIVPGVKTEVDVHDIVDEFRKVSDLKVPLLLGWKRMLVVQSTRTNPKYVYVYQAPCGKIYQTVYSIRRYLHMTNSKLDIDYFTIDRDVDLNRNANEQEAYVFEENIAVEKSTKKILENKFISLVNQFSEETLPLDYEYRPESFPHPMLREKGFSFNHEFKSGCDCEDDCNSRPSCACHRMNEEANGTNAHNRGQISGKCQYKEKRLTAQVSTGIFECNSFCNCSSKCPNRVVQNGIRFRLQVRKTQCKGWGVITLDDIPPGAFISTYAAELLDDADMYGDCDMYYADLDYISVVEAQKLALDNDDGTSDEGVDTNDNNDNNEDDDFGQQRYQKRKSNGKRPTISDDSDDDFSSNASPAADFDEFMPSAEVSKSRYPKRNQARNGNAKQNANREPVQRFKKIHSILGESHDYTLDARMQGNVGRFYNHSCDPNSFVQNVFIETHDLRFPVVAFFSKKAIAAMDEITWNYNYKMGSIPGREIKCDCGAPNCAGRIL